MKLENEREILPLARSPWNIIDCYENHELLSLFNDFMLSDKNEDTYKGWAFDVFFIKQDNSKFGHYLDIIKDDKKKQLNNDWVYYPINKDDKLLIFRNNTLVVFHLHSFLWNYPTSSEMEDE